MRAEKRFARLVAAYSRVEALTFSSSGARIVLGIVLGRSLFLRAERINPARENSLSTSHEVPLAQSTLRATLRGPEIGVHRFSRTQKYSVPRPIAPWLIVCML